MKCVIPVNGKGTSHFVGSNEEGNNRRMVLYPGMCSVARPGSSKLPCKNTLYCHYSLRNRNFSKLRGEATLSIPLLSFFTICKNTKTSQQSCRPLRNTGWDLKFPLKKTNNWQKGYSFKGAKSWNGLSAGAQWEPYLTFQSYTL